MKKLLFCCLIAFSFGCYDIPQSIDSQSVKKLLSGLTVLGTAQDAGFPQADCRKQCCSKVWGNPSLRRSPACLALYDASENKYWLFEATPDIKFQMNRFQKIHAESSPELAGIFLTHAHIGHYTGLMHLGHEVMGAKGVPVYAMPRMHDFLTQNGPWSQLVSFKNIELKKLAGDSLIQLTDRFAVTPFRVPHRDEFSETVGFKIQSPERSAIFIPDIDKWEKWERNIIDETAKVDLAFLDATFFKNGEIPGRNMSQIPHPFVEESMQLFKNQPASEKQKIRFIHFNHTNPILQPDSKAKQEVEAKGFGIAAEGDFFEF